MTSIRHLRVRLTIAGATLVVLAACSSLLDVTNPNQLKDEDLANPSAAPAIANGALSTVASGVSSALLPQSAISDELKWVGSYDSGRDLFQGVNISNPRNEFTMTAFQDHAQGRWTADNAIKLLSDFDTKGTLANRSDLARSYLYGALAYLAIGDLWQDFTLSDRRTAAPPLGDQGMLKVYDTAIGYLDKAVTIAQAKPDKALEVAALAVRARAKHARAVRVMLAAKRTPTNPLVNDASAVADAQAFLTKNTDPDYKLRFRYAATSISNTMGSWINERREFRISDVYGIPDATDKVVTGVRLTDPISGTPDAALVATVNEFRTSRQYAALTLASARETRLILAEAALAGGNMTEAVAQINAVRALDGKPAYDPAAAGAPTVLAMLKHERRVSLFFQGRRLLDMYRFGDRSPTWLSTGEAVTAPGTLLPIADIERNSNCFINGSQPCP